LRQCPWWLPRELFMSIQAISWALSTNIGTTILCSRSKLVLVALAEYADNDKFQCWPSTNLLALRLQLSRMTVYRCLKKLVLLGLITHQHRRTARGFKTSPLFTVLVPISDTRSSKPSTNHAVQPSTTPLVLYNEPSIEPSLIRRKVEFDETERRPSQDFMNWQKLRNPK
jgi:hypothetical protein